MKSNNDQFNVGDILKTKNLIFVVINVSKDWLRLQIATRHFTDYYYREHENYSKKAISKWIKDNEMTHYSSKQSTEYNISIGDLLITPNNNTCTVVESEQEQLSFEWYNANSEVYKKAICNRRMVNHWIDEGQLTLIKVQQ
jgi:hypothetical protein